MARTLIGQLILRMQQNVTGEAKKVETALQGIENKAKSLGNTPWGARMQRQLELLKVSPQEASAVKQSWANLMTSIQSAGMTGKDKRSAIADWRTSTLGHFADVRSAMAQTEVRAKKFGQRMQDALKPAMTALGFYTAAYGGGMLIRGGLTAGSEREREVFRQDMAGVPLNEQTAIAAKAVELSNKYRSVDQTQIMEMARTARNTMGSTDQGLAILEDMVAGYVSAQSAKGVDAASSEMGRLIRGLDNLGFNAGGEVGLDQMREIIAGAVRAVQIEGYELDMGSYFDFARRAKIAGPALSTEFMTSVAPALMQDQTASGAGTALSSGYSALVTGSSAVASKVNLQEQRRLGLRAGEGGPQGMGELVAAELYGQNPYAWVKEYLIPALQRDNVDTQDEVAVGQAVSKLSRNSMATGLWTRLVTQQEQIDRNIEMYSQAMGPEAGVIASERDPFVAYEGFLSSLSNLSGAVAEKMNIITPGLNTMADLINRLAGAVQENPALAAGGIAAAGLGAAGIGTVVWSWLAAGPQLQTAATMLQAAAASLQGKGTKGPWGDSPGGPNGGKQLRGLDFMLQGLLGLERPQVTLLDPNRPREQSQAATATTGAASPYDSLRSGGISWGLDPDATTAPSVDTGQVAAAGLEADTTALKLQALNATLRPMVDTTPIGRLVALLERAIALQNQLGSMPVGGGSTATDLGARVRASYSDYGVTP